MYVTVKGQQKIFLGLIEFFYHDCSSGYKHIHLWQNGRDLYTPVHKNLIICGLRMLSFERPACKSDPSLVSGNLDSKSIPIVLQQGWLTMLRLFVPQMQLMLNIRKFLLWVWNFVTFETEDAHMTNPPIKIFFFLCFWLCWVFIAVQDLPLVAASRDASLHCGGHTLFFLIGG